MQKSLAWVENLLQEQGGVVVEPWLARVFDFSIQYEMTESGLNMLGLTRMLTDKRGQFLGSICNGFCQGLEQALIAFLMDARAGAPRMQYFYDTVFRQQLGTFLQQIDFRGALGVDAFVYRDRGGLLKLKAVVEINPRYTMGRVGLELQKYTAQRRCSLFQIVSLPLVKKAGYQSLAEFVEAVKGAHPVVLTEQSPQRIKNGSLQLNDADEAEQFLALYHVGDRVGELLKRTEDILSGKKVLA